MSVRDTYIEGALNDASDLPTEVKAELLERPLR